MERIIKHLEQAYEMISRIPVSGDNVERMAHARQELCLAFREADEILKAQAQEECDGQTD